MNQPCLTREDLIDLIESEDYHVFPDTTVTICCLKLKSGFNVIGKSACMNPENFSKEMGEVYSRADAIHNLWDLEGYRIINKLHESKQNG